MVPLEFGADVRRRVVQFEDTPVGPETEAKGPEEPQIGGMQVPRGMKPTGTIDDTAVPDAQDFRPVSKGLVQTWKAPAVDYVRTATGRIVANIFNKVKVQDGDEAPVTLETPFWAIVDHKYEQQTVLVTWVHN